MQHYSASINIMMKAARKAARQLVRDYGEIGNLQSTRKGVDNFVQSSYQKVERSLIYDLQAAKPDNGIIVQKSVIQKGQQYNWIINPIDGISNFSHALPFFAISIALERILPGDQSEITAAVVDAPILGETYWADKGAGSWLERHTDSVGNSNRMRVSGRDGLVGSIIALEDPLLTSVIAPMIRAGADCRILGATDLGLAFLAAGKFDGFIAGNQTNIHRSAGSLMVLEAGGLNSNNGIHHCISNNLLYNELSKIIF